MAGLAKRFASASVSATKMWRCTPIAAPPGNSAFGRAAFPLLANASLKAAIFAFAVGIGPSVTKWSPCSPAHVEPMVLDDPYQNAGCGCRRGRQASGRFAEGKG